MESLINKYGEYAVAGVVLIILGVIAADFLVRKYHSKDLPHGAADDAPTKRDGRDRIDACNAIYDAGESMFSDFESSVESFSKMGGATNPFLDVLVTLRRDHAAEIFYFLGQHPDEAARVMKLQPEQIQKELATYSALADARNAKAEHAKAEHAKADLPPPDAPTRRPAFDWVPPLSPEPSTGRALILLLLLVIHAALWIVWLWITGFVLLVFFSDGAQTNKWLAGAAIWIAGAWAGWHIAGLPRRWAYSAIYGESDRLRMLIEQHLNPPQR